MEITRTLKCNCGNTFKIRGTTSHLGLQNNRIVCYDCDPKIAEAHKKELGLIEIVEAEKVKATLR